MAIRPFLAMTAAEMREISQLPTESAWMACHFSPYGTGLSNLPKVLPPGSLLILNDRTPIHGHDAVKIAAQLSQRMESLNCWGLLLDFQRPGEDETAALVSFLTESLPCPVGVSEPYAAELGCPVFLPPTPLDMPLAEYIAPWSGREVWLELALNGEIITLTEEGAVTTPLPFAAPVGHFHRDSLLHCHYQITLTDTQAQFTLCRTPEDLNELLEEAEALGVTTAVGLYQELHTLQERTESPND